MSDNLTTDDFFLGDELKVLQPARGFRSGLDAIVLAAACPDVPGAGFSVLDVGAGVGVAGLAVAARLEAAQVTLVEREAIAVELARLNIRRNGFDSRVRVVEVDVTQRLAEPVRQALGRESFDVVMTNPPYHDADRGRLATDPGKRAANAMPAGTLDQWARFMAHMAKPGGQVVMIHRAEAVGEIIAAFGARFGGLLIVPLYPREAEPAIRVLVAGIKGSRAPLRMLPGLVLHGAEGRFRPEIDSILRAPLPLPMDLSRWWAPSKA